MKKILKYAGIGTAVILGLWIAIETVVIIFTGEEPQKEPTPIAIEEIKADPQEKEPEQQEEQPEEPIKETPATAPIVAPIIVEEPPKVEEPPEKVEEVPEVVEQPKEEPKQEIVEEPQEKVYDFVLNTNTNKYHDPHCRSVKKMSEKNKEYFTGTVSEVKSRGFEPCEICQ